MKKWKKRKQEEAEKKKERRRKGMLTSGELKKREIKRILLRNQEMTGRWRKLVLKEHFWVKIKKSMLTRRMNCNWIR